jgi:hypothetical protein
MIVLPSSFRLELEKIFNPEKIRIIKLILGLNSTDSPLVGHHRMMRRNELQ